MTIYTAIFSPYDTLKEPAVSTKGWRYICFTDQQLQSKVWEIVKVKAEGSAQLTARYYKIMFHHFIEDSVSIWIDASFVINCNLNHWMQRHFKAPMTAVKHPIRNCIYREAEAVVRNKRKGIEGIEQQIRDYKGTVPPASGLIQSGLLMREKTSDVISIMQDWWQEVQKYSLRDQISFTKVTYQKQINTILWDYRKAKEFRFKGHITPKLLTH